MLVLEDADGGAATAAHAVYGEIAGYARHLRPGARQRPRARPAPGDRAGAGRRRAGTRPTIDVVFADAAGVPELDRIEAEAHHRGLRAARGAGHRAQDDDRAAATPAPRRWTWPPRCWPSATA